MRETAVRLGPWRSLIGVVTEPERGAEAPGAPFVLFLNAGILHHVGPHRLHVKLARRLARLGIRSLRFDVSGCGDSGARQDRVGRPESLVRDTQDAMQAMATLHGAREFVLFGICAGADQAVRTARADPRVAGAVLVDGYAYETPLHFAKYYAGRALQPTTWWHILSRQHPALRTLTSRPQQVDGGAAPARATAAPPRLGVYSLPPRETAEAELASLAARGCRLFFVYTPTHRYSHATQFASMFRSLAGHSCVSATFLPNSDHVFTLLASQEALMAAVESWLRAWLQRPGPEPGSLAS